jgi:Na+-translocating ferredoxin:NAD+ oxidoreductase RnfA subunit
MFIFNRPFGAVAAGIGFALAMALIAALCEPASGRDAPAAARAPAIAGHTPLTCVRPEACGMVRAGS